MVLLSYCVVIQHGRPGKISWYTLRCFRIRPKFFCSSLDYRSAQSTSQVRLHPFTIHLSILLSLIFSNSSGILDPVCYVSCCGQTQHTTIAKRTVSPYWDETLFFDLKLSRQQFTDSKLTIRMFNAHTFKRNEFVGAFEFDLVCLSSRFFCMFAVF